MRKKAQDYFIKWQDRYEEEYQKYLGGEYTKQQFEDWVQTQIARGESYEIMVDKLSQRAVDADKLASDYINNTTPGVYCLNRDYEAYNISKEYGPLDFHLADERTVREMMVGGNHTQFKTTRIDPVRDYQWNNQQIHSAVTSAILQGKSIDDLTKSFLVVMKRDENSARRNARTAITSAQNAGRNESYRQAEEMGIEVMKEWLASLDSRTRDSHAKLDGERVKYDAKFSNGLRYPGDPDGAPGEVYNCRCTMKAFLPKYGNEEKERAYKVMGANGKEYREFTNAGTPKSFNGTYKGNNGTQSFEEWQKVRQILQKQNFYENKDAYVKKIIDELEAEREADIRPEKSIISNLIGNGVTPIEPKKYRRAAHKKRPRLFAKRHNERLLHFSSICICC